MNTFIGYGKHWIDENDILAVIEVLKGDFLTQGPKTLEFEKEICQYTGAKYCVVVSNGTAALHLAVAALTIPAGKEGITSPNTFLSSSNSLIYNNLIPKFADIDPDTYCICVSEIEKQINKKTAVIIPVHFAGQPCEMKRIKTIADKTGLYVIEDAAHAIGAKYEDGTNVGNCKYSDLTIFSFHPVKTITTGEGGAITTNNKDLYEKLLELRSHGITKSADKLKYYNQPKNTGQWYYEMQSLGYNYRLTDLQAALGIIQLKKLDSFVQIRRKIVNQYNKAFKGVEWLTIPYERQEVNSAFHLYVLLIDYVRICKTRQQVIEELRKKNIGTQVHYIPVHTQPYYKDNFGYNCGDYPNAEKYYKKALSIPLFPRMSSEEVDYIVENIIKLS